jgi:hypothetical protein
MSGYQKGSDRKVIRLFKTERKLLAEISCPEVLKMMMKLYQQLLVMTTVMMMMMTTVVVLVVVVVVMVIVVVWGY